MENKKTTRVFWVLVRKYNFQLYTFWKVPSRRPWLQGHSAILGQRISATKAAAFADAWRQPSFLYISERKSLWVHIIEVKRKRITFKHFQRCSKLIFQYSPIRDTHPLLIFHKYFHQYLAYLLQDSFLS